MRFVIFLLLAKLLEIHAKVELKGIDVHAGHANINWAIVKAKGISFVYIRATQGNSYVSPAFQNEFTRAANARIIRGAYHMARPQASSGSVQAKYFMDHGGTWTNDGKTLPGALFLQYPPTGERCYGLLPNNLITWIKDFSTAYRSTTGRYPVIYTTKDFWRTCGRSAPELGATHPLWIAKYGDKLQIPSNLPDGWSQATFWQKADSAKGMPGGQDVFFGDEAALKKLATG